MAAVTIVSRKTNVAGARKQKEFTISGNSGDTLDTRMKTIRAATTDQPAIITALAYSTVGGYQTITFTASAPFVAVKLFVDGN
jgi:hypothetical protein